MGKKFSIDWDVQGGESPDGLSTCTLVFPYKYFPVIVDTDEPWERDWSLTLPFPLVLDSAWTFIGLDPGDHAEMDIELYGQTELLQDVWPITLRSLHRHHNDSFESWAEGDRFGDPVIFAVRVFFRARKMPDMARIRAHFGVKLVGRRAA